MAIIHFFLIHKLLVKSVIRDIAFLIKLPHQNHAWPLADSIVLYMNVPYTQLFNNAI